MERHCNNSIQSVKDCKVYRCTIIDASAVLFDDDSLTIFTVNRNMEEDYNLDIDLRSFGNLVLDKHIIMHHVDVKAFNSAENQNNVVPGIGPGGTIDNVR